MDRIKIPFLYDYVFPNFIMPNALITEYGILNYLNSLYTNKHKNGCLTDKNLHDQVNKVPTMMFDNNLGHWPNSNWNDGTHLVAGPYQKFLECQHDSVFFGKQKYGKYIYPIKISPHVDDFTGIAPIGSKLNGEYFWKHMSFEALKDAQNRDCVILLDLAQENFFDRTTYVKLHRAIELSGIPAEQIVLVFNSFNAKEMYENWFSPEERRLEVMNLPFIISNVSYHWANCADRRMNMLEFLGTKNVLRKNAFLFKIRRQKDYRHALLYKLASDDLLDMGDWSCINQIQYNQTEVENLSNAYRFQYDLEKVKKVCEQTPHRLQLEPNSTFESVGGWGDLNGDSHKNSYFYICTETYINDLGYKSLTEKVFKPLVNFQPFLFVAYPGALQLLRNLGFKTFHPFIDESYDLEQDEVTRINMIYQEIKKLCAMSNEELHAWYWQMQDILIFNHHTMIGYHSKDNYGIDVINKLHEKIK
jgi:hypothetical protein